MEGKEKPHMDKYKEITNDWNYDANCTFTLLPASDLEHFKRLIFVAECVHAENIYLRFQFWTAVQVVQSSA
jgi:hypothetical protein